MTSLGSLLDEDPQGPVHRSRRADPGAAANGPAGRPLGAPRSVEARVSGDPRAGRVDGTALTSMLEAFGSPRPGGLRVPHERRGRRAGGHRAVPTA